MENTMKATVRATMAKNEALMEAKVTVQNEATATTPRVNVALEEVLSADLKAKVSDLNKRSALSAKWLLAVYNRKLASIWAQALSHSPRTMVRCNVKSFEAARSGVMARLPSTLSRTPTSM